jgi:hypothetical protein
VQVLEHEYRRPALPDRVDEPAPGRGRRVRVARPPLGGSDQDAELTLDPARLVILRDECSDRLPELLRHDRRRVAFSHARLGLDDLSERPEGHALAVREAASGAPRERLAHARCISELVDEPRLADSRCADEGHELGRSLLAHAREQ